jgi:endonuclease YncB( thermonuclease family)
MKGDNWLCADQPDSNLSNQGVVKVVDGDTLAIVHLPLGLLKETLT